MQAYYPDHVHQGEILRALGLTNNITCSFWLLSDTAPRSVMPLKAVPEVVILMDKTI